MTAHPRNLRLILAIAAFVVLDLGVLAFNFQIARQVESDAVAINLAGRQRMLSQRVAKASLLATKANLNEAQHADAIREASEAYELFRRTLKAFAEGGDTVGGDGNRAYLEPASGRAALLVGDVRGMLEPWPRVPASGSELERFAQFIVERNLSILDAMNQLTSELQHQSVSAIARLRMAQTLAFLLSLVNFFLILFEMNRARRKAIALSITDALTGLLNRAGLYRVLEKAVEEAAAHGSPLGVMLLDLDGFKAVNDQHGHAAGDETLQEAARRIQSWLRPGWHCGRLGGDEFAVVCPGLTPEALPSMAADLGKVLTGLPGGNLLVSASVGYAAATPGTNADALIAAADASMYADKTERRHLRGFRSQPR